MKKLSKEKRKQLVLVVAAIAAVLGLIYFGLIRSQYASLASINSTRKAADAKLLDINNMITKAGTIQKELEASTVALDKTETDMASGDLYAWTFDTLRRFKQSYRVEIPEVGHPAIGSVDLLPDFPFKQIRFPVNGTAYYHDLGKFIADFENAFPHARLVNLVIEPAPGADSAERLAFKMDIIALVKSNPS